MRTICSLLLVLLAAPVFAFDQAALDKHLDAMAQAKRGDAAGWKASRGKVVDLGVDTVPALEAASAAANWTSEGWRRALAAEVCRLRISKPEFATEVEKPRGIDPAEYRKFRHGKPSELVRRAITAAQDAQYGFAPLAEAWQRDYGLPASVSMGLHLGNVVYGSVGPEGHGRFVAMGDAVNVAGRLMHRARAGEFVLSDSVMGALLLSNLEIHAQPLPSLESPRGPAVRIYGVLLDTRLDFT